MRKACSHWKYSCKAAVGGRSRSGCSATLTVDEQRMGAAGGVVCVSTKASAVSRRRLPSSATCRQVSGRRGKGGWTREDRQAWLVGGGGGGGGRDEMT